MSFIPPGRYTPHLNPMADHSASRNTGPSLNLAALLHEEHELHMRREVELEKQHRKREENLINSYEAEEDRIVVMLSRKLEQLRESKTTDSEPSSKTPQAHIDSVIPGPSTVLENVTRRQDDPSQARPRQSPRDTDEKQQEKGREADLSQPPTPEPRNDSYGQYRNQTQPSSHRSSISLNGLSPANGYDHSRHSSMGSGLAIPESSDFSSPDMSLSASPSDTRPGPLSYGLYSGYTGQGASGSSSRNGQQQQQQQQQHYYYSPHPPHLSPYQSYQQQQEQTGMMLEPMMRENEQLKSRLANMQRDFMRISRLNELYREELIRCRGRLGLPVDDLIGLASDPYAQYRSTSSSTGSSPSTSVLHIPTSYVARHNNNNNNGIGVSIPYPSSTLNGHSHLLNGNSNHHVNGNGNGSSGTNGVPIPRPSSRVHRPKLPIANTEDALLSTIESEPSSACESIESPASPFPFSPRSSTSTSYAYHHQHQHHPSGSSSAASAASTNVTSPPSSFSLGAMMMNPTLGVPLRGLSYPSVPPPSLSSSYGSTVWDRDAAGYYSPMEGLSRRSSNAGMSVNATGTGRRGSVGGGGGGSGRIVETGSLRTSRRASGDSSSMFGADGRVVRSRAGSLNLTPSHLLPEKVDEAEADDVVAESSGPK